jgi:hypothetical protein
MLTWFLKLTLGLVVALCVAGDAAPPWGAFIALAAIVVYVTLLSRLFAYRGVLGGEN